MARNWSSGDIVTAANLGSIERGVNAVSSMYEPTTWENGDVFTAEKLNNIEQGIENASNLWTTLIEESVTTEQNRGSEASGIISISLTEELIRVTFNGVEYICNAYAPQDAPSGVMAYGSSYADGEPTFDDCPFWILSNGTIVTQTAGTYTIKIEAPQSGGSSDFSTATVTITNSSGRSFAGAGCQFNDEQSTALGSIYLEGDGVIDLVLYKGSSVIELYDAIYKNTVALSGDVEGEEDFFETNKYKGFIVTGDCTITILNSSNEPDVK